MLENNGNQPVFPDEDQWTAARNVDGQDYVQIGDGGVQSPGTLGESNFETNGYFPKDTWAKAEKEENKKSVCYLNK